MVLQLRIWMGIAKDWPDGTWDGTVKAAEMAGDDGLAWWIPPRVRIGRSCLVILSGFLAV